MVTIKTFGKMSGKRIQSPLPPLLLAAKTLTSVIPCKDGDSCLERTAVVCC